MKLGLRLQILLLLGGLLLLSFVPLFFAVATYTRVTLQQLHRRHARALGDAVTAHVADAAAHRSRTELQRLLEGRVGQGGIVAIGVYDPGGARRSRAGEVSLLDPVERRAFAGAAPAERTLIELDTPDGPAIALLSKIEASPGNVREPAGGGAAARRAGASEPGASVVVTVVRTGPRATRARPLVRLLGLYTGVMALALLVLAYFALTRLIVRPLDALSQAARRVAAGARKLEVPSRGPRELVTLGQSVRSMTERLIEEESALRHKVAEVEKATRDLEQAQDRLIRSERLASVGRLAAGLAHEIGNPISALMGLEDLLLDGDLTPEERHDFLQRMRRETERIHRILRDLLEFARPSAQSSKLGSEKGDVARAIDDTVALVTPQKALKGIEIKTQLEPELPLVPLSGEQLVQVILNLVLNAADACSAGGRITIAAEKSGDGLALSVTDTGPGIPPEIRERLFEPFVTTKEVGKGTGLGLAVCRGLVEAAGGNIQLDPEFSTGARFRIWLPSGALAEPSPPQS